MIPGQEYISEFTKKSFRVTLHLIQSFATRRYKIDTERGCMTVLLKVENKIKRMATHKHTIINHET